MSIEENKYSISLKKLTALKRIGLQNESDFLYFFPRNYLDKSNLIKSNNINYNEMSSITLEINKISDVSYIRKGLTSVKVIAFDEFSVFDITFFNQVYINKLLKLGEKYVFHGKIQQNITTNKMTSPKFTPLKEYKPKLEPLYKLTSGVHQKDIRTLIYEILSNKDVNDFLPTKMLHKYKLLPLKPALWQIHFPKTNEELKQAKRRFDFQKLFLYILELKLLNADKDERKAVKLYSKNHEALLAKLPFSLTYSQQKCINDCILDMQSGLQMNRILQGDVGCGKTIVATILSYLTATNNLQTAFVVPTEILALQHFSDVSEKLKEFNIRIELLTGSTSVRDKKRIKTELKNGEIDIIIGTHAIFTKDVEFQNLSLVVIDEQHRFGVNQRSILISKGENPHTLVMSATPIPRTVSLLLYGDLSLSIIDEMPKGRKTVDTFLCDETKRTRMYNFVRQQIESNNQVYIICPLVEVTETDLHDLKNVTHYTENLKNIFPDFSIEVMHGKLKTKEKDEIMREFSNGKIDILVSTTVIEVGVNVPNATLMVIENAERFGLATLHQLRGRVGRGADKSFCILMSNSKAKRLDLLTKTNDGFIISKEDLNLRGSGDYYGVRQSGESEISTLNFNPKMLDIVSLEVNKLLNDALWGEKHASLHKKVREKLQSDTMNIFN